MTKKQCVLNNKVCRRSLYTLTGHPEFGVCEIIEKMIHTYQDKYEITFNNLIAYASRPFRPEGHNEHIANAIDHIAKMQFGCSSYIMATEKIKQLK